MRSIFGILIDEDMVDGERVHLCDRIYSAEAQTHYLLRYWREIIGFDWKEIIENYRKPQFFNFFCKIHVNSSIISHLRLQLTRVCTYLKYKIIVRARRLFSAKNFYA